MRLNIETNIKMNILGGESIGQMGNRGVGGANLGHWVVGVGEQERVWRSRGWEVRSREPELGWEEQGARVEGGGAGARLGGRGGVGSRGPERSWGRGVGTRVWGWGQGEHRTKVGGIRTGGGRRSRGPELGGWQAGGWVYHPTIWYPIPLTSHQSGIFHFLIF